MHDRYSDSLEFQRDLLSLSGLARELPHPQKKKLENLLKNSQEVAQASNTAAQSR